MAKQKSNVKHTRIQIGDTIRCTGPLQDATVSIVGVVGKRWYTPGRTVVYETTEGVELLMAHPDGTMTRGMTTVKSITILNRDPYLPPPMF